MQNSTSTLKGKSKEVKISLSINRIPMARNGKGKARMAFDVEEIPDDVWLTVFEYLNPTDLGMLSRTCQKFHGLTQRPLLRELTWATPVATMKNIEAWGDGESLQDFRGLVRKVKIRLTYVKVNQNGAMLSPLDWELYDLAHHRLFSFSNLRCLQFSDTVITPSLYPVLAGIPSLREVSMVHCTFTWSYLYDPVLSNLGRPAPPDTNLQRLAVRDLRPPRDPAHRAAHEQWLLENATFDFARQLSHITHFTFKSNRFSDESDRTEPQPYHRSSEINRPCILHPLYMLTIPSITDLTLSWTIVLMQVYETLKQNFTFDNVPVNNANGVGQAAGSVPTPNPAQIVQMANTLYAANPYHLNLFQPLNITFPSLRRVTLLVEDLSRDMMDSIVTLFEPRINSPGSGIPPLQILLKVTKHTLTEQHIGAAQFRLPGVYRYEGPLPIAGLLNQPEGNPGLEEVRMTEAMDMNMILYTLEKLPRSLKKLEIRMYAWDQEILYAVRMLFKQLTELDIRYGVGNLKENTHIILGSDILPDLKELHTFRLLSSYDCRKKDPQLNFPFLNPDSDTAVPHHSFASWWPANNNFPNHLHHNDGFMPTANGIAQSIIHALAHEEFDVPNLTLVENEPMPLGVPGPSTGDDSAPQASSTPDIIDLTLPDHEPSSSSSTAGPSNSTHNNNRGPGTLSRLNRRFSLSHSYRSRFRSTSFGEHAAFSSSSSRRSNTAVSTTTRTAPPEPALSDIEEQKRVAQSLKDDLVDYLVGWNRHCPRLRVVQMEPGITWVRKYDGDAWRCEMDKSWSPT